MYKRSHLQPIESKLNAIGLNTTEIDKQISFALLRINESNKLKQCTVNSVCASILYAANLGLSVNPEAQECALIARKNKDTNQFECTLMPMYQGIANLAFKSGNISQLITEEVRENDKFEITPNNIENPISHSFGFGERGKPVGYYTLIVLENGFKQAETMDLKEVEKIRDLSDGYSYAKKYGKEESHPWGMWFGEMARKACLKRALKYVNKTKSTEKLLQAIELDNRDYKIQHWQVNKIERLLTTSTLDPEQRAFIEEGILDMSAAFAERTIENLQLNQAPNHPGYNDRVNKTTVGTQVLAAVEDPNT